MSVDEFTARLVEVMHDVLGADLVAVYVHGSLAMGGFRADRSDIDVLAVVADGVGRGPLLALAAALSTSLRPVPAQGLELDVLHEAAVRRPLAPSPFALNLSLGEDGQQVTLGEDHGPHGDPVLHLAAVRAAGITLAGPAPAEMIGELPRRWLLEGFAEELDWGLEHGSPAYAALNAARCWRYARDGVVGSKLAGGEWALGRGYDEVLGQALAFQRGETQTPPDRAAATDLVARAQRELRAASG